MEQFFHFIFLLVGFVLILLAARFTARWMGGKWERLSLSKYVNIIDRVSLGNENFIYLMRIGEIVYIIGVTKTNMQMLDKFKKSDLEILPQAGVSNAFTEVLYKYFKKRPDSYEKERHKNHDQ